MFIVCNRVREAVEKGLHRHRRYLGEHEGERIVGAGLDRAENVSERIALIGGTGRALAPDEPAVADAALLADPRFILEKQADTLAWMCISNRR